MDSASARYESKSGVIESKWIRSQDTFSWEISIPPQSKGVIYVPTYGTGPKLEVNGMTIEPLAEVDGFSILGEFGSGSFHIEATPK